MTGRVVVLWFGRSLTVCVRQMHLAEPVDNRCDRSARVRSDDYRIGNEPDDERCDRQSSTVAVSGGRRNRTRPGNDAGERADRCTSRGCRNSTDPSNDTGRRGVRRTAECVRGRDGSEPDDPRGGRRGRTAHRGSGNTSEGLGRCIVKLSELLGELSGEWIDRTLRMRGCRTGDRRRWSRADACSRDRRCRCRTACCRSGDRADPNGGDGVRDARAGDRRSRNRSDTGNGGGRCSGPGTTGHAGERHAPRPGVDRRKCDGVRERGRRWNASCTRSRCRRCSSYTGRGDRRNRSHTSNSR